MFYVFELMANTTIEQRIRVPNQGTNVPSATVSETDGSFAAFPMNKKMGT